MITPRNNSRIFNKLNSLEHLANSCLKDTDTKIKMTLIFGSKRAKEFNLASPKSPSFPIVINIALNMITSNLVGSRKTFSEFAWFSL